MKISLFKSNLKFYYPFTISKATKTHQVALICKIEQDGILGWGEAPVISYYNIPFEKMLEDINLKLKQFTSFNISNPYSDYEFLLKIFPNNSFVRCAFDIAIWDWYAKKENKSISAYWSNKNDFDLITDYTIGISELSEIKNKITENPSPVYKVKLGTAFDKEILLEIRKHTQNPIRVDVNGAWTLDEAINILPFLESQQIELIEEPLMKYSFDDVKLVQNKTHIPIYADESCVDLKDVLKCEGSYKGINIKLTKCGGITPCLEMIEKAKWLNLEIMIGTMNESAIGSAAIAHLMPLINKVDMDGILLLEDTNTKGLSIINGKTKIHGSIGLGIEVIESNLEKVL